MKKYLAEFVGTFALVFAGTGAIVINEVSGGQITHVGVALTFGLIVMAMIFALGPISGAHLNPVVTCGFFFARRFPGRQVPAYLAAQLAGALAASVSVRLLFPSNRTLGATLPSFINAGQACVLEAILTAILMLVILQMATGDKERGLMAAVAIGGVVGLEAMFAGPVSGASMNPWRSLAPAIVSGNTQFLWAYIIGPLVGAAAGTLCSLALSKPAKF